MDTPSRKRLFSFSAISTVVLVAFIIAVLTVPAIKASVTGIVMKTGLLQPHIPTTDRETVTKLDNGGISFLGTNNKNITLSALKGKVVFLNFWATWCPPCRAEMPSIDQLYAKLKDNPAIVFLIVNADGSMADAAKFVSDNNYSFTPYIPSGEMPEALFGGSMPTTVILNKDGNIVLKHTGAADYNTAKIEAFMNRLASKPN